MLVISGLAACLYVYIPASPSQPELFFLPKEILLHVTALVAACYLLINPINRWSWVDGCMVFYFLLSVISMVANSTYSVGWRPIGITASSIILFHVAREVGAERIGFPVTMLSIFFCSVAMLQAIGWLPDFSLDGRSPGSTLGNRNEAARVAVLFMPITWREFVIAKDKRHLLVSAVAITLIVAAIVLSRARTAWIATLALSVMACLIIWRCPSGTRVRSRTVRLVAIAAFSAIVAGNIPVVLQWESPGPYWSTLTRLFDVATGTGKGRVVQHANTLQMAADHPAVGVGPGAWMLRYSEYRSSNDPSFRAASVFPTDRLPQSDFIGGMAERGILAAVLLVAIPFGTVLQVLLLSPSRSDDKDVASRWALAGIMIGWLMMGFAEPVVALPVGAALLFIGAGIFWATSQTGIPANHRRTRFVFRLALNTALALAVLSSLARVVPTLRSTVLISNATTYGEFEAAVRIDPTSYAARIAVASFAVSAGDCENARSHLAVAARLNPSGNPFRLAAACDSSHP